MYLQNKYTKWYFSIIRASKSRNLSEDVETETHHIIPKCLGGTNEGDNLAELTLKEHYVCHLLLTKMVSERVSKRKMWYAHYMMMRGKNRYRPTSRMYELAKRNMILANKDRPGPNLGKKMTEEQKEKLSKVRKGKKLGPMTAEHRQKLSKPKTEEHKKKLSESKSGKTYGYKHSEETKRKMSESHATRVYLPKTEEQKKKQSDSLRGRKQTPEHVAKRAEKRKGKTHSEETKQKIREARAKQVFSNETRQKMSDSRKRLKLNTI